VSVLVNGEYNDHIPVSDRGLHYGDGLFETLAVVKGVPRLWDRHMSRLSRGEAILGLPATDKQLLRDEADRLCHGASQGVLKLILTRGSGGRGYRPPVHPAPRRLLSLHPWPEYPAHWYRQGMRLRLCETRCSCQPRLAGVKHLNRLDQVLARNEWQDPEIAEGVMCDEQGRVVCVTQGNLFLLTEGRLSTPDLCHAGVAGVMRELVIDSANALGIPVEVTEIPLESLYCADALFVTNAILGVCAVGRLNEQTYSTAAIPQALLERVTETLQQERQV
jgi:4-amino-4-deoxychorismate lyase